MDNSHWSGIIFRTAFASAVAPSQSYIKTEHSLSIRRQCELTGVNRSELYRKPAGPSGEKLEWLEKVMERIDYWHTIMPFLGSRRLAEKLQQEGLPAGRKLVRRLMYEMAIYAIYPKPNLSRRNFKESVVPYLLRNKQIHLPNQVWSVDITYIKLNRSHMYLTAVIDWYSRKIVGWNLADTLDTTYVIQAVETAIEENGCPCIINSDQGCQFTSSEYKQFLCAYYITQSMGGKSRWADNIRIERWFRSLKTESANKMSTPKNEKLPQIMWEKKGHNKTSRRWNDFRRPNCRQMKEKFS